MNDDHCPRNREGAAPRIPIDAIRSRFLASETCTGVGISEGVFPSELSLALGALEGFPAALLSTTKIVRGTCIGPLLVPALAQSGLTFGQIFEVMKQTHVGITADVPSFVLLGDPTTSLQKPSSSPLIVRGEISGAPSGSPTSGDDEASESWSIEATPGPEPRHFLRIDLHGSEAERVAGREGLTVKSFSAEPHSPSPDDAMTAIVVRQVFGAPLSVLLIAARPFEMASVRVHLIEEQRERERIESTIAEVEENLFVVRTIQKSAALAKGRHATPARQKHAADLSEAIADIEMLLAEGAAALQAQKFPVHPLPVPWAASEVDAWLAAKLAEVDARLAAQWPTWNMSHYLPPLYVAGGYVSHGNERVNRRCYLCGGASFDITMRSPRRPAVCRTVSHCGRCGILSDHPHGEAIAEIRGPSTVRRGERLAQRLVVTNSSNHARTVAASASIEGCHAWFTGHMEPTHVVAVVPAGSSAELDFDLVTGESTTPGTYNCVFFASSRLATTVSVKPIAVVA